MIMCGPLAVVAIIKTCLSFSRSFSVASTTAAFSGYFAAVIFMKRSPAAILVVISDLITDL